MALDAPLVRLSARPIDEPLPPRPPGSLEVLVKLLSRRRRRLALSGTGEVAASWQVRASVASVEQFYKKRKKKSFVRLKSPSKHIKYIRDSSTDDPLLHRISIRG